MVCQGGEDDDARWSIVEYGFMNGKPKQRRAAVADDALSKSNERPYAVLDEGRCLRSQRVAAKCAVRNVKQRLTSWIETLICTGRGQMSENVCCSAQVFLHEGGLLIFK